MTTILIINAICSTFIITYLWIARSGVLGEAAEELKLAANSRESQEIDLSLPHTFVWKITKSEWEYEGDARVILVLDRKEDIPLKNYEKETMTLKVKMNAYAITASDEFRTAGLRGERLLKDWYFITDEPLAADSRLGSRWGTRVEHILAGIVVRDYEDLYIEMQILLPDPVLSRAKPRLRIEAKHKSSMIPKIALVKLMGDIGFVVSILVLVLMNILLIVRF